MTGQAGMVESWPTPSGSPWGSKSRNAESGSAMTSMSSFQRCVRKGWPGGTERTKSQTGSATFPRNVRRSERYGCRSDSDRGGSLEPEARRWAMDVCALVSMMRSSHSLRSGARRLGPVAWTSRHGCKIPRHRRCGALWVDGAEQQAAGSAMCGRAPNPRQKSGQEPAQKLWQMPYWPGTGR